MQFFSLFQFGAKMPILGKFVHFTCTTLFRSKHSSHKFNLCTTNLCACKRLLHSSINSEKYQENDSLNKNVNRQSKSLLRSNYAGFLSQNRSMGIAAKFVNNSPRKIQPYMKLMRIDKPIGETNLIFFL